MPEYFVTIGIKYRDGHPLMPELTPKGYLVVEAPDELAARRRVTDRLGDAWAFMYQSADELAEHHPEGEQARLPMRIEGGQAPMFGWAPIMNDREPFVAGVAPYEPETGHDTGITISAGWSTVDEGVRLIMIDTSPAAGRVRVELNSVVIFDRNPDVEESVL